MDQFYLDNVKRYQMLVDNLKAGIPKARPGTTTQLQTSPDLMVTARIRPLQEQDIDAGFPRAVFSCAEQSGVLDIHDLYNYPWGKPILKSTNHQVDRVFDSSATSSAIFDELVTPLIHCANNGGVATLFAYGQTGSGKTFTVSQLERLAVTALMAGTQLDSRGKISIAVIDLAGSTVSDLLNSRKSISILEDSSGTMQLAGVDEHEVDNEDEMLNLIERASSLRQTASTMRNDASSRSHAVCRIRVRRDDTGQDGFLYFIDLAGSEAARDVVVHGADRMRETREINLSLSVLKDCIRAKSEYDALAASAKVTGNRRRPRIPFRQSALTKVLKHVFDPTDSGRSCKTVVIACVNPCLADAGPSKNTMRYAEMLRVRDPESKSTV